MRARLIGKCGELRAQEKARQYDETSFAEVHRARDINSRGT